MPVLSLMYFLLSSFLITEKTAHAAVAPTFGSDTLHTHALPNEWCIKIITADPQSVHQENTIEVPFRLSGNLMVMQAEVNGQVGNFIFDSGAPGLKLNSAHFQEGKKQYGRQGKGITGVVQNIHLQHIDAFKWEGKELKGVQVESFDLSHIEKVRQEKILGLIGFDIFKEYEICLDYKHSKLILYMLDKQGAPLTERISTPTYRIRFKMCKHIPIIEGSIANTKLKFGIDTGAELNILDMRSKQKVLKHFQIIRKGQLNGNGSGKVEVFSGKIDKLEVGGIVYYQMRTVLTNLYHMNQGFQVKLDGMLGGEFLNRRLTAINFKTRELLVWDEILPLEKEYNLKSKKNK